MQLSRRENSFAGKVVLKVFTLSESHAQAHMQKLFFEIFGRSRTRIYSLATSHAHTRNDKCYKVVPIDMQCVLAKNPTFFFLWLNQVFFCLGEWIVNKLLSIHLRKQPHAHVENFPMENVAFIGNCLKCGKKIALNIFYTTTIRFVFYSVFSSMKKKEEYCIRSRMQTCKMSCVVHLQRLNLVQQK